MIALRDASHVVASYAITFAAVGLYTWTLLRRARKAARQIDPQDRPWT